MVVLLDEAPSGMSVPSCDGSRGNKHGEELAAGSSGNGEA